MPEVEPRQDASLFDLFDYVAQVSERARRTCGGAGERELDLTGAEERAKRLDHRAAVTRVRRGVSGKLGVARNGRHVASGSVAGFASVAAIGIAALGRQNL